MNVDFGKSEKYLQTFLSTKRLLTLPFMSFFRYGLFFRSGRGDFLGGYWNFSLIIFFLTKRLTDVSNFHFFLGDRIFRCMNFGEKSEFFLIYSFDKFLLILLYFLFLDAACSLDMQDFGKEFILNFLF
jgi:hypothetical protein